MANAEISRSLRLGSPNTNEKLIFPNVDEVTTLETVEELADVQLTNIVECLKDIASSELKMAFLQSIAGGLLDLTDDVRFKREGDIPQ